MALGAPRSLVVALLLASACGSDELDPLPYRPPPPPEPWDPPEVEEPFEGPCIPESWLAEVPSATTQGAPSSFSMTGAQLRVVRDRPAEVLSVAAPMTWVVDSPVPQIVFDEAVVDGRIEGVVVLRGATFDGVAGRLEGEGAAAELELLDVLVQARFLPSEDDDGTRPDLGSTPDPLEEDALAIAQLIELAVLGLEITGFEAAHVVTEDGVVPLTEPFELTAERFYWPAGSRIDTQMLTARFVDEIFVGLDPREGSFAVEGEQARELPLLVWGYEGTLEMGPEHVATLEPMRVRQAIGPQGALVPAEVELRSCNASRLVFHAGQRRVLRFAHRERSGQVDAVFGGIELRVDGDDVDSWEVRIEVDSTLPPELAALLEESAEYGWGSAVGVLIEIWNTLIDGLVTGFTCAFSLGFICPANDGTEPPDLLPFPGWMRAATAGEFELEVVAPVESGEHEITIVVVGQNYQSEIPLTIVVPG